MMPVAPQPEPTDASLRSCLAGYRKQAKTEVIKIVWKRFRASNCGKSWFSALQRAYGHRCLYCDHAPTRVIDHSDAKSTNRAMAFAWDNLRPSCGDCNHQKGTSTIVDPLREDPRAFIEYDVSTGKPMQSPKATPRAPEQGEGNNPPIGPANAKRCPASQASEDAARLDGIRQP